MNSLDLWCIESNARQAYRDALVDEQAQMAGEAMAGARGYYKHLPPLVGTHPWLEARSLPVVAGMRRHGDFLVVPIIRDGNVASVYVIRGDDPLYWPGAVGEGFFPLSRPGATLTVLIEGLAPGLAIFAATTAKVLVGFGGIPHQAPAGLVVVAPEPSFGDWCSWRMAEVERRMENRRRFERDENIRRAVDAEIAAAMARAATFRPHLT